MKRISEKLKDGKVLVSDGAWGTILQEKGLVLGECPEYWNIKRKNDILDVALAYVCAGADMIGTNSFGANYFKLKNYGLENLVYKINRKAAEISHTAGAPEKFVIGSMGPTGKLLNTGEVEEDDLFDCYREQSRGLMVGDADAVILETMSDLEECLIAINAVQRSTKLEIICTMTFEKIANGGYHTMMGVTPSQMTHELVKAGADIIGANCGNGIEGMIQIVEEIRSVNKTIPILVHVNAGLPIFEDGKTFYKETPESIKKYVIPLINAGANIIGGCCGTGPAHIKSIAEIVDQYNH